MIILEVHWFNVHDSGKILFDLMFKPGERICCSIDKFGYHSIPLENAFLETVTLVSPNINVPIRTVKSNDLTLIALNPMKHGFRVDDNCSAYRNFLVEMDCAPLPEQLAYIKKMGMPYSAVVFSGNKSLHFLISLDTDLPSEKVYRIFSEWILSIITLADQATKNPSRSIRIPGAMRDTGKLQELTEYVGPIKIADLINWLKLHPDAKPQEKQERKVLKEPNYDRVKGWAKELLYFGISPPNRNRKWFSVAVEFALSGYEEEYTIDVLKEYFEPDKDFKEKEWEITVRSAFKWAYERKQ